jgi:hypothetical protein
VSQDNVELVRRGTEAFGAGTSESDFTKIAELWDPEIELDVSEMPVLDISGSTGEPTLFGKSGESGLPLGKPPHSTTSWSMPVIA